MWGDQVLENILNLQTWMSLTKPFHCTNDNVPTRTLKVVGIDLATNLNTWHHGKFSYWLVGDIVTSPRCKRASERPHRSRQKSLQNITMCLN